MGPHLLRGLKVLLAVLSTTIIFGQPRSDEVISLRKEVDSLQIEQRQLKKEIELIKSMLLGKQVKPDAEPLRGVVIETAGAASLGPVGAKVVLIEFSDFQCPFCARYARDTFGTILKEYVDTGRIQYVFRNFPLMEAHPLAGKAAEAAECARRQGKFWEAHDRLFRNQLDLESALLTRTLAPVGLDESRLRACLDGGEMESRVKNDVTEGMKAGVDATPSFFFGYRDEKDRTKVRALKMLTGAQPAASFSAILEYLLDPPPAAEDNR
jgi:protein-disulfide isomerase